MLHKNKLSFGPLQNSEIWLVPLPSAWYMHILVILVKVPVEMKVYQAARNKLSLRVLHSQDQPVFFAVFHLKIYIYKYIYENKVTDIIVSAH